MDPWVQLATAAFKRTPKTPLSFFCRLAWIVGGIVFGALYSSISNSQAISGLSAATVYNYRVKPRDAAGEFSHH